MVPRTVLGSRTGSEVNHSSGKHKNVILFEIHIARKLLVHRFKRLKLQEDSTLSVLLGSFTDEGAGDCG